MINTKRITDNTIQTSVTYLILNPSLKSDYPTTEELNPKYNQIIIREL